MLHQQLKKGFTCALAAMLGLFLGAGAGFAQTRSITGTVTDETGEPLIGASVTVEGNASVGVVTDLDGHYELAIPASAQALRFSYIGQEDLVEQIGGRTVINAVLKSANMALEATVVTAMGITKAEKSLSYNVQQMELPNVAPTGSFVNSLSGKVAGVQISQASTGVGGASRVVMRGTKSLSNNNNALYVIDGIPMAYLQADQPEGIYAGAGQTGDALSQINPDDIESISVLSGPSAAALYGSSAANGVVVITTKKGAEGRVSLNYSNTTEFSRAYIMPSLQSTYGATEEGSYQSWGAPISGKATYNPRDFFQTGISETNAVSLSSGNDKNQIYASVAANNARGIIHNNNLDKYNFSMRNTTKFLDDRLTLDLSLSYSKIEEQNMVAQGEYHNPVVAVYLMPADADFNAVRIFERYNAERNFKTQFWPYGGQEHNLENPYWITDREMYNNYKNRFMASAQAKYDITKWLNISARVKMDRNDENHVKKLYASTNTLFASQFGAYSSDKVNSEQKYGEFLVNVNKYFGDNIINVTATVGANIDHLEYGHSYVDGHLKSIANLFTYSNLDLTDGNETLQESGYVKEKQAIFANTQIGWRSRVYLDLTARNDWSSSLAQADKKSFFYYSAGLSGLITELIPGLKSKTFPYWKIRASYSEVGNDPEVFLTRPTYPVTKNGATTRTRMNNTDLQPELTKSYELGTNIHFFDSRLQIDATLYKSKTYNQFFEFKLPDSGIYSSVIANAGNVSNRGIEVSVRYGDDFGAFHWDTYATYSRNVNRIDELVKSVDIRNADGTVTPYSLDKLEPAGLGSVKTVLYEGGSMGDLFVSSLLTDEKGYLRQNNTGNVIADYSEAGFLYAGNTAPKHFISWGNNFGYKGFTLGFQFNARLGGIVVSKTQAVLDYFGISQATADARDRGYVMINGMKSPSVQEYYQVIGGGNGVMSEYVYDATNVRLSELTLGYDFPVQKWCKWCKGLNLSIIGHNLLMIYKKAPFDPEMTSNTGTYFQGIDYFMQPSTRSLGFSVKVKL